MELVRIGAGAAAELVEGAAAVQESARADTCPWHPPVSVQTFRAGLVHGWDGDPAAFTVAVEGGRVVGVLEVGQPRWDNHHVGHLGVDVLPGFRRRGIGRALFAAGAEQARDEGRTTLMGDAWDLPAAEAFCRAVGLEHGTREAERRLDLGTLDRALVADLHREALVRAGGYELLRLPGAVPDPLLEPMAALTAMINDAPTGELDVEDEVYTAERIRAFEVAQAGYGRRMYRVVARHRGTGVLAGHTVVAVHGDQPWYGGQYDTSVAREHRGHRLGLLLKTAMLGWLAEAEPQLRCIDTWNAVDNTHMVALNDALGCRVMATASGWQRGLAARSGVRHPGERVVTG
jgi:GNAT superfamily N-acetyltransferase